MTAYNLRSLLLAAIVLSNCITWTASRHHYTHSIHGHRSRHRRQGAGLFLASSYIIPGNAGEDRSDGWGEWGEVSPCSRTCGGGVASQKRICLKFESDGQPQCKGGDTKYFSCHTQDCPDDSRDFRAEQCSEFNDKDFRGAKYEWVPYTRAVNPCELNCMPHGERFYYRHKPKVIDGTRCTDDSFDVCVDGTCQAVGCDMMLGSTAREDKCRKCRGNGINCHTNMGIIDTQDLLAGYNDVLLIPAGATTIVIEEIQPSSNYLALRNNNGTFYLNGYYHIDFPRTMMIAGALWTYESSHISLASPDRLKCLGPINESLYLSILLQEKNVGVQYEYSLPSDQAPPTDKRYSWVHDKFTPCSVSCGGGIQTRNVTCRTSEELEVVDDNLCDDGLKPATNQTCNNDACPAEWVEGAWGECSKRCGKDGERRREVTCQKVIANGFQSIVADRECIDLHGAKPHRSEECNTDAPCPTWFIGRWKACDKLCDEGKQTRQVVCRQKKEGRVEILDDIECEETKPETEKPCILAVCEGVDWATSQWFGCDTCLSATRTRQAQCVSRVSRNVIDENLCAYHPKPAVEEKCDKDKLPKCEVQWYSTQWSKCSVECGKGVQTRRVFCGLYDGESVLEVEDEKCANQTKYNDTKPCEVPKEKCPSQWYSGPWSECTEPCGGGVQYSKVLCLRGTQIAENCMTEMVPESSRFCNQQPCNKDEVMPVNSKAPLIIEDDDDLPECEDDDYPEVGLDADQYLSTMDDMLSDSPYTVSYAEPESSLFTETGSGFGSSLSTEDLEGSSEGSLSPEDATDSTLDVDEDYTSGSGSGETEYIFTEDGFLTSSSTDSTESSTTEASTISSEQTSTEESVSDTTGSTESIVTNTNLRSEEASPTESTITEETAASEATGSTESTMTESTLMSNETGSTDSTNTDGEFTSEVTESTRTEETTSKETGSTETAITIGSTETGSTESTVTEEVGSTHSSSTDSSSKLEETGSTSSTVTDVTPTTGSTESIKTDETSPSSETVSTVSDDTGSTDSTITDMSSISEETGSTESTITDISSVSEETGSTESTITDMSSVPKETGSTESTITDISSVSEETGSTDSTITDISSVSEETESTITDMSSISEETGSTESTVTDMSSVSEETGSTESTITETSSVSEETVSTQSLVTESSSMSEETGSTLSITTDVSPKSSSIESTVTEVTPASSETSSTDSTVTNEILTSSETGPTSTVMERSSISEETGSTENPVTSESSTSGETLSTAITEEFTTSSESSTISGSTDLVTTVTNELTSTSSDEDTEYSSISPATTTEISSTSEGDESSTTETTSSASSLSTVETETESTSISTESSSSITEKSSTGSSLESSESSTTQSELESTTEVSTSSMSSTDESTETSGPTTSFEPESTTGEFGSSPSSTEESTKISSSPTTSEPESSTGVTTDRVSTQTTEESTSTTTMETIETSTTGVTSGVTWIFSTHKPKKDRMCKPRKHCKYSKFGCCPDKITAAKGPFEEGCKIARTCKETIYGCCPDGVTPSRGADGKDCPVTPCEETLFGCCESDNKTAANGNDQEGCPPPPPACASSKYGCCADEETEAKGPDSKGCPEDEIPTTSTTSNTVSEASTPTETDTVTETSSTTEMSSRSTETSSSNEASSTLGPSSTIPEGCAGLEFGCCQDNMTEASGPDGEGCSCNTTEFGCCPDGLTPAEDENKTGCQLGCKQFAYGCCEDGKTPAHGPNFEGCCLNTAYGCCPDNRRPANGPHLEGCECDSSLYGCCPDNVTTATGPRNEGCGCQYSEFGCCPDRHTPATGPANEGCACHTFQFGCCPDGVTTAKGPQKQGCHCRYSTFGCCGDDQTPATGPDNEGCDCATSKYGCCPDGQSEAAGPKFLGCTDVPEDKQAVCSLSTDPGPCFNFTAMWFFDLTYGGCTRFWYGGCEGNGNKFATKEDCEDVCVQPSPKDACKLPEVKGPCYDNHVRWYYNSTREQCIPFRYGGCLGNGNNFDSRELCQKQCEPDRTTDPCNLPIEEGPCSGNFSRWGFNSKSRTCEPFTWGGCEGNSNRFKTEAACESRCNPPGLIKLPEKCTLPAEVGDCSEYRTNWFYDTTNKRCRTFYYGGCGGNENNFVTEAECENACTEVATTTITTTVSPQTRPTQPPESQLQPEPQPQPEPSYTAICFHEIDQGGKCSVANEETRYAYDSALGKCVTFHYLGCGGNQNNFPTEEHCAYYCHQVQDICQLPMMSGPCEGSVMSWFYDPSTDTCSQFTYGGCEGNANRFDSREACESRCKTGPVVHTTQTTTVTAVAPHTPDQTIPASCRITPQLEECRSSGVVWFFDLEQSLCLPYENQNEGQNCRHTATFESQEACERLCGAFREVDVCSLQPEEGDCNYYFRQWYYDSSLGQCNEFVYTGCGGNNNRFETRQDCEARCKTPTTATVTTLAVPIPPPEPQPEKCTTPSSLTPCGRNQTVFYYDSNARSCLSGEFGECNHPNSYRSEEECERQCGAFLNINVCEAPLDPGPCRQPTRKIYFDLLSGTCQPFTYGGCAGGPNRFSTVQECEEICGNSGPEKKESDCDSYEQACAALVCEFGMVRSSIPGGCKSCACVDQATHCEQFTQECDALVCAYGINRIPENGCERCVCHEDPCSRANCTAKELCVSTVYIDQETQEQKYAARCVVNEDLNEIPDCSRFQEECSSLRCEFGMQHIRTADGCERCECVSVEIDCAPLEEECKNVKCNYGMERTTGVDGCVRCKCIEHPCESITCPEGQRCVVDAYRDPLTQEPKYTADCRTVTKPGECPKDEATSNEGSCRQDCHDDADCRGVGKCCTQGCSKLCSLPVEPTTQLPKIFTSTNAPNIPAAPQALPPPEPEIEASEGGKATLRCLFHSNPPPKITWRRGEITINGNVGRYRLLSDGALEIVSLYRNDTGVYICVADNGLGVATQEVNLVVSDPVETPAGIVGDENAVVTGELNKPLQVHCMAYGYPPPDVHWEHGGAMVAFNDAIYEARGNYLLIRRLAVNTLGQYTCQAYNGIGKATSWVVSVRAYRPEGFFIEHEYLVPRYVVPSFSSTPPRLLSTTREITTTTSTTTTTERPILFTVPVIAHVSTTSSTLNIGAELHLACEVDGFPEPTAQWTKDGVVIEPNERISISGNAIISRLVITRVAVNDSGVYGCHASNGYTSHSDTAQINVQQITVPAKCTDNPYFAKCDLIVRSKYCHHHYYSKFCCKSCVEAGQLDPHMAELQADQPYRRK